MESIKTGISPKFFHKKNFKLNLDKQHYGIGFDLLLILLHLTYNSIFEIFNSKGYLIIACGSIYGKIILILLDKVIIVYIKLTFINIRNLKLKKFFLRLIGVALSVRVPILQECSQDPLQIILKIPEDSNSNKITLGVSWPCESTYNQTSKSKRCF